MVAGEGKKTDKTNQQSATERKKSERTRKCESAASEKKKRERADGRENHQPRSKHVWEGIGIEGSSSKDNPPKIWEKQRAATGPLQSRAIVLESDTQIRKKFSTNQTSETRMYKREKAYACITTDTERTWWLGGAEDEEGLNSSAIKCEADLSAETSQSRSHTQRRSPHTHTCTRPA